MVGQVPLIHTLSLVKEQVGQNRAYLENNVIDKRRWYEKAYEHYTEVLRLKPDVTDAYVNRGAILRDVGEFERALEDFNRAID